MRRGPFAAVAAVTLLSALTGAAGSAGGAPAGVTARCPWMKQTLSPDVRARLLLRAMNLSQKVALTSQRYKEGYHYGAAGFIPAIPALCIPELVFNDAGQGVGDGQTGTTAFPAPISQAASWDPALQYRFGAALGQEAHLKGVDVQLAPGIETQRVPMNGRNWEYASEDPFLAGQTAAAEVRGVQSQHVIVTLKHFIANSQETNRLSDSSDLSWRTMEELYAPQYDTAIHQGGAAGVMCSYNRIGGVYSCQNRRTLGALLDRQFGFGGFVVSDWQATHSTVASARAGLDIEMSLIPGTFYGSALAQAVRAKQIPVGLVNRMVLRILRSMFRVGVFDHPPAAQPGAFHAEVSSRADRALARRIAEEGTVLLRNIRGILPLRARGQTIAVIGPAANEAGAKNEYNGQGSGHVALSGQNPIVSPLQAITARAGRNGDRVIYADGTSLAAARAAARKAGIVILVVGDSESEGIDRQNLVLTGGTCTIGHCTPQPVDQNALIARVAAANPNTIVVLDTGGPVLMPWLHSVRGLLEAWYPGQQDGSALAALLFGDADPSGHLTETFPATAGQLPIRTVSQWPGVTEPGGSRVPHSTYSEGLLVGYRWYQARHLRPLFPFGFGLSYTTFRFSGLRLQRGGGRVRVGFTVTNTGRQAGADVAQVYVGDPPLSGEPPEQLKGFARVSLRPGQPRRVTVTLAPVSFAHWNTGLGTWTISPGRYTIRVGDSSSHLPLGTSLHRRQGRLAPGVY